MGQIGAGVNAARMRRGSVGRLVTAVALIAIVTPVFAGHRAAVAEGTLRAPCAPLDLALVLDSSTSMDRAIQNVKNELATFVDAAVSASGGDYRFALVDFATNVEVHVPFAAGNAEAVRAALPGLRQTFANNLNPEAWDEALATVVDNRPGSETPADGERGRQIGDFTEPWRPDAKKIVVLVTDARPAGFNDRFEQEDADRAFAAALRAAERGIRVATVFVPNGRQEDEAVEYLAEVAGVTGASHFATNRDGTNLATGLSVVAQTCAADSDGDGLYEDWEINGIDIDGDGIVDVDLPAWGATPDHKDLFLQVNWMHPDGARGCWFFVYCPPAPQVHLPDPDAFEDLIAMFAAAPVENPDGQSGIRVHIDAGSLSPPGTKMPPADRRGGPLPGWIDYLAGSWRDPVQAELLEPLREVAFSQRAVAATWVVYANQVDRKGALLGYAFGTPGDMFVVAGKHMSSRQKHALTVAHELGHSLGLRHGGESHTTYAPNYLSIMNYAFAIGGLIRDGKDGLLDYSRFELDPLDERNGLDETLGVTGADPELSRYSTKLYCARPSGTKENVVPSIVPVGVPVDWNCDGDTDDIVSGVVIRNTPNGERLSSELLTSRNDWATLSFSGGERGGLTTAGEDYDESGFTEEMWRSHPRDVAVAATGPGTVTAPAGTTLQLAVAVENYGRLDDTYTPSATVTGDFATTARPGQPVAVASGDTSIVSVTLEIPADASSGSQVLVPISIGSQRAGDTLATAVATVFVGLPNDPARAPQPLQISPATVDPSEPFSVRGDGFLPGTDVVATVGDDTVGTLRADERGTVEGTFDAPPRPGAVAVRLLGAQPEPEPSTPSTSPSTTSSSRSTSPQAGQEQDTALPGPLALEGRLTVNTPTAPAVAEVGNGSKPWLWFAAIAFAVVVVVVVAFVSVVVRRRA